MRNKGSILGVILTSVVLLTLGTAVLASDVDDALYQGNIEITNDGSTATNVAVPFTLSTQSLVDDDYIATNCSNTAIVAGASDTAYMPAPGSTTDWVVFVSSITDNSTLMDKLYTGGGDMSAKLRYFPGTGGMTTTDNNSTLELGDDFEIEQKGWIDTTSGGNKDLVLKQYSFRTYISASDSITSCIYEFENWISPTGFSAGDWADEALAYDDNTGTWADVAAQDETWTVPLILNHTGCVTSKIRYYCSLNVAAGQLINLDAYYGGAWHDVYEGAFTVSTWEEKALVDEGTASVTQIRIYIYNGDVVPREARVHEVDFGEATETTATATSVSSGEHTITTETGALLWAPGDALHFDGTTPCNVNVGQIHDAATKLWISFWFKLDSDLSPGGRNNVLWWKQKDSNENFYMYILGASGQLVFESYDTALKFSLYSTENSWSADTWYHVLGSVSSVNGARLRVNNGAAVTNANTDPICNGGDILLGGHGNGAVGTIGEIANFMIGTDDLSVGEEAALYNGTAPGDENNLWYIDEGTGTTITDYGTDGDDGTADASTSWESSSRPCKFAISIDGTAGGGHARPVTAPDNSGDWTFIQNNSMLYMESHKITISSSLKQHIIWENNASTFSDQSGNSQDAAPTFRTTSSDADVSAELVSFSPIEAAEATSYTIEETADILSAAPDEIEHMYTELQTNHLPGADLINDALDAADIPQALFWFPFSFGAAIIAGLIAYRVTSGKGSTQGSLLMQSIVSAMVLAFFSLMTGGGITGGVVPFWPVFLFAIEAFAVMIWSKQVTV